eukprot:Hpha_TRINITY_DN15781_c0_g2::TRINITY_DN15781_c0_g2_i2::g.40740::m.40740
MLSIFAADAARDQKGGMGDSVALPNVRVTGHSRTDGVVFYTVEVHGGGGGESSEPLRIFKRYNQFFHLKSVLDKVSGVPGETRSALSSAFPPRTYFSECKELGTRQRALDAWIATQLGSSRRLSGRPAELWKQAIRSFLCPLDEPETSKGSSVAVEELRRGVISVQMPLCLLSDGTVFYKTDVSTQGEESKGLVWKSYAQFYDFPLGFSF